MTAIVITPAESSGPYRAALLIQQSGPMSRDDLLAKVHFAERKSSASLVLNHAVRSGWLAETRHGIELGHEALRHFGHQVAAAKKYVGQVAAPRTPLIPLYERPPLSAKYRVSSKGFRDDVPEYSVREGVRFSTLGGRSL